MLETFGVYVRNLLNPCLKEFLVRINLHGKDCFKMRTIEYAACYEFLFVIQCSMNSTRANFSASLLPVMRSQTFP